MSIKDGGYPSAHELQFGFAKLAAKPLTGAERANAEFQQNSRRIAARKFEPWRDFIRADGSIRTGIGDGIFGAIDSMSNNRR
jgi:hypothetical protein